MLIINKRVTHRPTTAVYNSRVVNTEKESITDTLSKNKARLFIANSWANNNNVVASGGETTGNLQTSHAFDQPYRLAIEQH